MQQKNNMLCTNKYSEEYIDNCIKELNYNFQLTINCLLPNPQLEKEYPLIVFAEKMTTDFFLIHLIAHFTYHLGQINYHRRLSDA